MNSDIGQILNIIEEYKTSMKDIDYKTMLELLSNVNKQCNKVLYSLKFIQTETYIDEDGCECEELDVGTRMSFEYFDFYLSEEFYKIVKDILQNNHPFARRINPEDTDDARILNKFMSHFQEGRTICKNEIEFNLSNDFALVDIKKK